MSGPDMQTRKEAEGRGQAMQGGRFPIRNRADLEKAIRAVGALRGGDAGRRAVRRFIIRRAQVLGLSDLIPDTWKSDGSTSE